MKRHMLILVLVLVAGFLVKTADALQFTVDTIEFSELRGETEDFRWSVYAVQEPVSFDIDAGDFYTFTYGYFSTNDFSLDNDDRRDDNDSFTAEFQIAPPSTGAEASETGTPDANRTRINGNWRDTASVDFDNDPLDFYFGTGGHYTLTFLDTDTLTRNGRLNLQASLNFVSDTTQAPAPVPEPATMILLGTGLAGMVGASRKKLFGKR